MRSVSPKMMCFRYNGLAGVRPDFSGVDLP